MNFLKRKQGHPFGSLIYIELYRTTTIKFDANALIHTLKRGGNQILWV
jgi:hypothetical protein